MPICDLEFESGIFSSRQVGHIDANDARQWGEALLHYARTSPTPVIVLIDAREATSISNEARRIFAQAAETPNVRVAAVAASNLLVMQQSRIIALLGAVRRTHETHIFKTLEEAEEFASSHISPLAFTG